MHTASQRLAEYHGEGLSCPLAGPQRGLTLGTWLRTVRLRTIAMVKANEKRATWEMSIKGMCHSDPNTVRLEILVNGRPFKTIGIASPGVFGAVITHVRRHASAADGDCGDAGDSITSLDLNGLESRPYEHFPSWETRDLAIADQVTIRVLPPGVFDVPNYANINMSPERGCPKLPDGWTWLDPESQAVLLEELRRELTPRHVLSALKVQPLARHGDLILCRVFGAAHRLAVVELTWRSGPVPRDLGVRWYGDYDELAASRTGGQCDG